MSNKIQHGQFYTKGNCFKHQVFIDWYNAIPNKDKLSIIEPFAGANNIIRLMDEADFKIPHGRWGAYDIEPEAAGTNVIPGVKVIKQDTIANYPKGFDICITNPPYLAKNSAKRKKIDVDFGEHQDLFELSLSVMLANSKYVAAIIPESFISRQIFTDRLVFVISLNYEMFDDTDFPVCLAVFNPEPTDNFDIYLGDKLIGNHLSIKKKTDKLFKNDSHQKIKFNDPNGNIGVQAIDSSSGETIAFIPGKQIPSSEIKISSRAKTRVSLDVKLTKDELEQLLNECNRILAIYRKTTQDVFMTSFKGLRKDDKYRRRLDFATTAKIIKEAYFNLKIGRK